MAKIKIYFRGQQFEIEEELFAETIAMLKARLAAISGGAVNPDEPGEPDTPDTPVEPDEPVVPEEPELVPSEGLEFELTDDGQGYRVLSMGTCEDTALVIPDTHEGLPVTEIGSEAFEYGDMTSVFIPHTVTSIGNLAFAYCDKLTSLTLNEGLLTIGEDAFLNCSSLKSLIIPNSVTSIDTCAFFSCTSLTDLSIGSGLTTIENLVFSNCVSLKDVTIPATMDFIKDFAFEKCSGMNSFTFGLGYVGIEQDALKDCTALTTVTIGTGQKWLTYGILFHNKNISVINYLGTMEQWNNLNKEEYWIDLESVPVTEVTCIDGSVPLLSEEW